MKAVAFSCDGVAVPDAWRDLDQRSLRSSGSAANMHMRLEGLVDGSLVSARGLALDLVRIASYAYCADQSISRGGKTDVMLEDWRRDMRLSVPVSNPDFWSDQPTTDALSAVLNFVSEDYWQFSFAPMATPLDPPAQASFPLGNERPTVVALLSGGLDSAAGTFAACAEQNARPVLVSHRPSAIVAHHQIAVSERLRDVFKSWWFPSVAPWVNRSDGDPADDTQRTRSFLFLALGACVAGEMEIRDVLLSDNGVVSLNIPINDQLIGARASRSTHPKFIWRFNQLARQVWGNSAPVVSNPLLFQTREEVVETVAKYAGPGLIRETLSCQSPYRRSAHVKHCGVCSQCVGRRFATLAAGFADYDSVDGYNIDIFADELREGTDVTVPVSFVRFAASTLNADAEQFWADHEEFADAVLPDDANSGRTASTLMATLTRHAQGVLRVMKEQVHLHSEEIAVGNLPRRSLIALMGEASSESGEVWKSPAFSYSSDFSAVAFKGKRYVLSPLEATVVKYLHGLLTKGTPEIRTTSLRAALNLDPIHRFDHTFAGANRELWKRDDSLVVGTSKRDVIRLNQSVTASHHPS